MKARFSVRFVWLVCGVLSAVFGNRGVSRASEAYVPFEGEKTFWHDGFDRFDYVMDEESFSIRPFKCPEGEQIAVGNPAKGQRRCVVSGQQAKP